MFQSLTWSDEEIAASAAPEGFAPIISHSTFSWRNGPVFERRDRCGWVRGFRVAEKHGNAGGFCHGGMLMTFADIVLATAVLEKTQPPFVTVNLVSDFMGVAPVGAWVEGTATITGINGNLVHLSGELLADGKPCLGLSGIFKVLRGGESKKTG